MQQQHPVKVLFDAEPLIHQTMTKLLKTIMCAKAISHQSPSIHNV
jgi:hypothetical protein